MNRIDIDRALSDLNNQWGYENLRPKQKEVLQIMNEKSTLVALLPTGGGKSLCYQLIALQMPGITLVISPLISLMEDQIRTLKDKNIKAAAIHSGHHYRDIGRILDNCRFGDTKILYVAPERLESDTFNSRIAGIDISLLAVDEAHCISQWGYDFRPSYRRIKDFIKTHKPTRVMALTGTANQKTLIDISNQLAIDPSHVVKDSFLRKNIFISVIKENDKLNAILSMVIDQYPKTIIYTRSRRRVEMIASFLKKNNIAAQYYHAGLSYKNKKTIQQEFLRSKIKVLAATNAFGMGIDIPDIDLIIHYDIPPSMEEYYQEIGRAGRSQQQSRATLLYSDADIQNQVKRLQTEFPTIGNLYKTYSKLHRQYGHQLNEGQGRAYTLNLSSLSKTIKELPRSLYAQLKALQNLSAISLGDNLNDEHHIKFTVGIRALRALKIDPITQEFLDRLLRSYSYAQGEWFTLSHLDLMNNSKSYIQNLESLARKNVIRHSFMPSGPTITFLEGRVTEKDFMLKKARYELLKSHKSDRWSSIRSFINHEACRNQFILSYFNESYSHRCLNCDSCNNSLRTYSKDELIQMSKDSLNQVVSDAYHNKETQQLRLIQSLVDEKLLPINILPS